MKDGDVLLASLVQGDGRGAICPPNPSNQREADVGAELAMSKIHRHQQSDTPKGHSGQPPVSHFFNGSPHLFAISVIIINLLLLIITFVLLNSWHSQIMEPGALEEIATASDFEALCRNLKPAAGNWENCRKHLRVFQGSLIWVDSQLLLRNGEKELSPKHLDIFYGFPETGSEAERLAVGGMLASWCRQAAGGVPSNFEELRKAGCLDHLPSLAEMGLEFDADPAWADVRSIESDYAGESSTRLVPIPISSEER